MEFQDIDNQQDIESYLNRGYTVINNLTGFPMRLVPHQADLYAQKWAAVKGGEDYLLGLFNEGFISLTKSTLQSPAVEVPETSKNKKKSKETDEEGIVIANELSQLDNSTEVSNEIKDPEVQESAQ
jgi:hypothetical protein